MFSIQLNSGVPIYRQVVDQVVHLIDCGHIEPGELLPSVRQVAQELGVNPMTISRAWSVLESDSVVARKRGVGMVVIREPVDAREVLGPAIRQLVADARQLGLNQTELTSLIKSSWKVRTSA